MNRGGLGARSLNIELQNVLNPPGEIRIERFGWTFCPGDKVMQVENDYDRDVYNGDLGFVSHIDMEEGELHADFDGRDITYGFGELDELVSRMRRQSIRAKARSTRQWSSRWRRSIIRCCSGTWSTRG
jgi:exodeoxyribonuclease V alpha subunit